MFEKLIVKIMRRIIAVVLPQYHLHKDPQRKQKAKEEVLKC